MSLILESCLCKTPVEIPSAAVSRASVVLNTGCEALTEWEYLPPVGPRPTRGFVGLKNAGATCYMNSVIQQLYMIPPIRNGILAIEGTGSDIDDDMSGDEKQENEVKSAQVSLIRSENP